MLCDLCSTFRLTSAPTPCASARLESMAKQYSYEPAELHSTGSSGGSRCEGTMSNPFQIRSTLVCWLLKLNTELVRQGLTCLRLGIQDYFISFSSIALSPPGCINLVFPYWPHPASALTQDFLSSSAPFIGAISSFECDKPLVI
jgi:hypothetical protein